MQAASWPNPPHTEEYALRFDRGRARRLLVIPALFDEGNKLRHFTVQVMRALDNAGIDSMLPDLPGTNESLLPLPQQTLGSWQGAMNAASEHFRASHALTIRGGVLCASEGIPTIAYAPVNGSSMLRAMLRASVMADREAGIQSSRDGLMDQGLAEGIVLAGYALGDEMLRQLEAATIAEDLSSTIAQAQIGGPGLWLRAEPDHDQEQAESLASIVAEQLA